MLEELLKKLENDGCHPAIIFHSHTGKHIIWHAQIYYCCAKYCADASTPLNALQRAMAQWNKAGKPKCNCEP